MSDQEMTRHDQILIGLIFSLQAGAMQQLGKVQNPMTGEIEIDLVQAKSSIDVLEMLKAKCRTDTPAEILRILDGAVMDLQLNYMDEVKKAKTQDSDSKAGDESGEKSGDQPESSPASEKEETAEKQDEASDAEGDG